MAVCSNQVSETCLIMLVCLITPANISTLFQRWLLVDMTLRHRTTSNQGCFQLICLLFKKTYFKENLKEKSNIFEMECILVDMTLRHRTTSNQRWNNVVSFNLEIYNIGQHRMNVLHFSVDMNVDNVEATLSFWTYSFTTLVNVKTTFWKWPLPKRTKKTISNWIHYTEIF